VSCSRQTRRGIVSLSAHVWCNTSSPIAPRLIARESRIIPALLPAASHWHDGHESLRTLSDLIDETLSSTQRPITSSALSPSAHRDSIPDFADQRPQRPAYLPVPCSREVSCLLSSSSTSLPPSCTYFAARSATSRLHLSLQPEPEPTLISHCRLTRPDLTCNQAGVVRVNFNACILALCWLGYLSEERITYLQP
jgi:hypothetical protein